MHCDGKFPVKQLQSGLGSNERGEKNGGRKLRLIREAMKELEDIIKCKAMSLQRPR